MHTIAMDNNALFACALPLVRLKHDSSISFLQRHFSLTYTAAQTLQTRLHGAGAYDSIKMIEEPANWEIRFIALSSTRALVSQLTEDNHAGAVTSIDSFSFTGSTDEVILHFRRHVDASNFLMIIGDGRCASSVEWMALLAERARIARTRCWIFMSPYDQSRSPAFYPPCELLFVVSSGKSGGDFTPSGLQDSAAEILAGLMARNSGVIRPSLHEILTTLRAASPVSIGRGAAEGDQRLALALHQAHAALPVNCLIPTGLLVVVAHGETSRLVRAEDIRRSLPSWISSETRLKIAYLLDDRLPNDYIEVTLLVQASSRGAGSLDKAGV